MATKIQIKRGTKANLPALSPGEFGLTTDTEELYIGGNSGNIRLGKNGESSTPNATATHSGGVVAITAPAGVNLISFYAPSDFSGDDTYTVNGSAVTLTDLNGNAIYDGWKEGAPVQLILKGTQAFFKSGGGVNDTLPPLNPNMTGELADGVFTVTADKLPVAQADALAGAEWYYGDHVPARPGDGTKVEFTREQLVNLPNAASDFSPGDIVKIKEDGVSQEFYIAKHGYPVDGNGRTLLVRRYTYDNRQWNSTGLNAYAECTLDDFFENTYYALFSESARAMISAVTIPYTPGNGNDTVTTLSRKIFALSVTELGKTASYANVEGSALPIASTLQIAYNSSGRAVLQWTRSPNTSFTDYACCLYADGSLGDNDCTHTNGARPAFTIPSTALFDPDTNELIEDATAGVQTLADVQPLSGESISDEGSTVTLSIPWTESGYCYCRQFPYNAKHQYQTQLVGAVATNDPDYGSDVPALPEFEYTGTYQLLDDGDGNWRIKFTTSGTLTMAKTTTVDVFLVGGGASGGGLTTDAANSGGGGGYTQTYTSIVLEAGTEYPIVIGAGGKGVASGNCAPGGATTAFGNSASGANGKNGGSGGGSGNNESRNSKSAGVGGSDGGNGGSFSITGGVGQGTTTREFGEPGGELYSGGGGGASYGLGDIRAGGNGGAGGPSESGGLGGTNGNGSAPSDGIGGGGGTGKTTSSSYAGGGGGGGGYGGGGGQGLGTMGSGTGGNGFQGIAIIRNHREAAS